MQSPALTASFSAIDCTAAVDALMSSARSNATRRDWWAMKADTSPSAGNAVAIVAETTG